MSIFKFINDANNKRLSFDKGCMYYYDQIGIAELKRAIRQKHILNGTIELSGITNGPKYYYVVNGDIVNREEYRKHDLVAKLSGIDVEAKRKIDTSDFIPGTLMRR